MIAAPAVSARVYSTCAAHWLAIVNVCAGIFVGLPLLAPLLMAAGWATPALAIYAAYGFVCHQWAFRSYFLLGSQWTYSFDELSRLGGSLAPFVSIGGPELGYKVAFCERDLAIYASVVLAGLAYARFRAAIGPLAFGAYLALITPMAVDGFSQLFGWRESTPLLRVITGGLFGLASVWLLYPRLDLLLRRVDGVPSDRLAAIARQ